MFNKYIYMMKNIWDWANVSPGPRRRMQWLVVGLLLGLALGIFGWRGVARAIAGPNDFPTFYAGSKAWLERANPYDLDTLNEAYAAGKGYREGRTDWTLIYTPGPKVKAEYQAFTKKGGPVPMRVYWFLNPPQSLPLLAFLGWLSFPAANLLWLLVTLAFIGLAIWRLTLAANLQHDSIGLSCFVAFTLALSPFHTTVSHGQFCIVIAALTTFAMASQFRGHPWATGIYLALAASLKPQMVIAHGFYYLLRWHWRVCLAAGFTLLLLGIIGVSRMEASGIPWLESWRESFSEASITKNNPAADSLERYMVLSLPMLLHLVIDSAAAVQATTLAFAIVTGVIIHRVGRRLETDDPLLLYTLLGELSLLVTYHRIYDATLLIFPLAWSIGRCRRIGMSVPGGATLGLLLPFVPSGTAVLVLVSRSGVLPRAVTDSWAWRLFVLPHAVWLILALFALHLVMSQSKMQRRRVRVT
jgi:hypothetical protein